MKISREKLFSLNVLFDRLSAQKTNVHFHYNVAKNKRLLVPELECIQEARKPSEKFNEFTKKRIELCKEYCKKDEDGNDVIIGAGTNQSRFDFEEGKQEELDEAIKPLTEEYKEVIKEHEDKEKQFFELLNEEVEIPFTLFKLKHMPQEVLGSDVEMLFDLIEE